MKNLAIFFLLFATQLHPSNLKEQIDRIIEDADPTALVGVKVVSADSGMTLYEKNAKCRFVPGSAIKIIAVGAAFEYLGSDDCFITEVQGDGDIEGGVLKGNLYLVGSGDPSLSGLDLVELAEGLKIKKIEGDLVLDKSCFKDSPMGPGWMWDEEPAYWCSLMNGLNVEHNCINGIPVQEGEKLTGVLFRALLERKGILVNGTIRQGKAPKGSKSLSIHKSKPLRELAKIALKMTDNLYANCIFKKMGGSWKSGRKKIKAFLRDVVYVDPQELVIVDGSGESRYNLISPNQMVEILKKMKGNKEFREALPIGNKDGTLKRRMSDFGGKVEAKTGTMTGVSALCGYVSNEAAEEFIVAVFVNGFVKSNREIRKNLEDEVCRVLVNHRGNAKDVYESY